MANHHFSEGYTSEGHLLRCVTYLRIRRTRHINGFLEYLEEAAFDFSGDFDRSGVEPRGLEGEICPVFFVSQKLIYGIGHADRISAFPYPFQDVPRITLGCPVDQFSPTSISSGECMSEHFLPRSIPNLLR